MFKNTIAFTHLGADFDAIASLYGICKLEPNAIPVLPSSLEGNVQKFVTLYGEVLNFQEEKKIKTSYVKKLILVDTRIPKRIGELEYLFYQKDKEILVVDHHPVSNEDIKATHEITKPYGSTTTIIVELLKEKNARILPFEATLFALGIYEDTGGLLFPETTPQDALMVSFLLSLGADIKIVNKFLNSFLTEDQQKIFEILFENLKQENIKGAEIGITFAISNEYVGNLSVMAHRIMELLDLDGLFVVFVSSNNTYIVARSRSNFINTKEILEKFGGGGHPTASSATIKNFTDLEKVRLELLKEIERKITYVLRAKDIMSSPVKIIDVNSTIKEAEDIMYKYGYSCLPVVKDKKVIGVISKKEIERLKFQDQKKHPVKRHFTQNVVFISPDENIREIQKKMVLSNVGRVLIKEEEEIIGIISRSDLLKAMYSLDFSLGKLPFYKISPFILYPEQIAKLIMERFPKHVVEFFKIIGDLAEQSEKQVYLVGGSVRDLFLGIPSTDFDIVVEGDALAFASQIREKVGGALVEFPKFGTAKIILKGLSIDFSTSRHEFYPYSGSLPMVERASLKEDLFRRDFTINTLAIQFDTYEFGKLFDFYGGLSDLRNKIIRVLHNQSFIDDPTRLLRAIKYEAKFKFNIEEKTLQLIKSAKELNLLNLAKNKRAQEELKEILTEFYAVECLLKINEFSLLRFNEKILNIKKGKAKLLEELKNFLTSQENNIVTNKDQWLVYILVLIYSISIKEFTQILSSLSVSKNKIQKFIKDKSSFYLVNKKLKNLTGKNVHNSLVYALLSGVTDEFLAIHYASLLLQKDHETLGTLKIFLKIRETTPFLNGKDCLNLGMKEGKEIGKILKKIFYLQLDGEIKTREKAFGYLRNILKIKL